MTKVVQPIPTCLHTVTPSLIVRDAAKAIDFYKRAFGAEEIMRMTSPDGKIGHAEIKIGDSVIFLSDEFPEHGCVAPSTLGSVSGGLNIYVPDVDAVYQQALDAGAKPVMPVADMFWGDRFGQVTDPSGHRWSVATHKEDLTQEEISRRAQQFYAEMAAMAQKKSA